MKGMKKSAGVGVSIPFWGALLNLSYLVNEKRFVFSFWAGDDK